MDGMLLIRSKRGLMTRIAEELGISRGAVAMWDKVPAEKVVEIERITSIPRETLRPDLYRSAA